MFPVVCIVLSKLIRSTNKNVLCFMHDSKRSWEAEAPQKTHQEFPSLDLNLCHLTRSEVLCD